MLGNFGFNGNVNNYISGLTYKGTWDALLNFPILVSSVGTAGDYYIVSVAGSTNLDGITDWQVGDWAIFEGGVWQKVDNHDVQAYNFIQDEGVNLPQQNTIDFQGLGVTATNGVGKTVVTIPNPNLQSVVNVGNGISNFGGIGNASIQCTNFLNNRTLYLNDNSNPTIKIVDNLNGSHYTTIDIDTLNLNGNSYNWSDIVQAYSSIADEGSPLPQRQIIDFQGAGVTASDNGVKTIVTIPSFPPSINYGLFAQTALSTPITATISELSLIGTGVGTLSVPANTFNVGDSFVAKICGKISCANNETLHIRVKSGAIILADSGALSLKIATNKYYELALDFTVTKIGANGVAELFTNGLFSYNRNADDVIAGDNFALINNTTFNTTILNNLSITAQWGSANANNSIQSQNFVLNKTF